MNVWDLFRKYNCINIKIDSAEEMKTATKEDYPAGAVPLSTLLKTNCLYSKQKWRDFSHSEKRLHWLMIL